MSDNRAVDFDPLVSREHAENTIASALRLYVGRGRRYSVKQLANGTGVKDRRIEAAMLRSDSIDHRPLDISALLSISSFLGASFTNEWLHLASQGAFDLPDDDASPGTLAADTSEDAATVVRAAVDGHFDQEERQILPAVGARMMATGAKLVAMGGRAA